MQNVKWGLIIMQHNKHVQTWVVTYEESRCGEMLRQNMMTSNLYILRLSITSYMFVIIKTKENV